MKISLRILLGYFAIVGVAAFFVLNTFMEEVKPGVRQAMEDTLVETANLLAGLAGPDLSRGELANGPFATAVTAVTRRPVDVQIYDVHKTRIETRVTITDLRGVVVYDSAGEAVGQDHSKWRDVVLTLRGHYGARSSPRSPDDPDDTVMHVAAPITVGGALAGVLTVAKPNRSVEPFVERSRSRIFRAGLWLLGISLAIGLFFAVWITGSLGQLVRFAERVARGERAEPPDLGGSELARLSAALAHMRDELEGRQYVERYVHTLTHEMKSPLTAIAGAAELLGEDLPEAERLRFSGNVTAEASRLRALVDRMLGLAAVEARQGLQNRAPVDLLGLCRQEIAAREALIRSRELTVALDGVALQPTAPEAAATVSGDAFLLGQAIGNLLDNAIDFSPLGGTVEVEIQVADAAAGEAVTLSVRDRGPGLPDYAEARVFERFFSLPRPDSGRKSTGIGLTLVREVATLHGGSAALCNREGGGAVARLVLPGAGS
ncbi:MAG: two-component system sensor histidine kinase CreC [Deltaproteobacteria bacterium]|nr:two-component system sensor histidine kinase CreC [Deltaproteobacteria bacterium]